MSNSSPMWEEGEFTLFAPGLMIFAPISLSDEEGEKLFSDIKPYFTDELNNLKKRIEERFPNVRLGFNVE